MRPGPPFPLWATCHPPTSAPLIHPSPMLVSVLFMQHACHTLALKSCLDFSLLSTTFCQLPLLVLVSQVPLSQWCPLWPPALSNTATCWGLGVIPALLLSSVQLIPLYYLSPPNTQRHLHANGVSRRYPFYRQKSQEWRFLSVSFIKVSQITRTVNHV